MILQSNQIVANFYLQLPLLYELLQSLDHRPPRLLQADPDSLNLRQPLSPSANQV